MNNFVDFQIRILKTLKESSMTVSELSLILHTDEYYVMAALAELNYLGLIEVTHMKKMYSPGGCPIYDTKYFLTKKVNYVYFKK